MGLRRLKQQSQHRQQNHIDQHEEVHPKRRGPKLRMLSFKCAASYVERNGGYHECDHSYIAKRAEDRCDLVSLQWLVTRCGTSSQQNLVPPISGLGTASKLLWYRRDRA